MDIEQPDAPAVREFARKVYASGIHDRLTLFLERMLGRKEVAQEILQEIYVRGHRLPWAEGNAGMQILLFDTATRLALLYIRRSRTGDVVASTDDSEKDAAFADLMRPDKCITAQSAIEQLRQAVDTFPPDLREVFVMRYARRLSLQEIAGRLNVSIDAVDERLRKALVMGRERLSGVGLDGLGLD